MNWQHQNRNHFLSRKSHLNQLVKRTFIEGNEAVIPCQISQYSDIISTYSVPGYETLNPDFQAYILDIIRFIPDEYPIVLDIRSCPFDLQQQEAIETTIRTDMLYSLGEAEMQEQDAFHNFLLMIVGCVLMGIFLSVVKNITDVAHEFFYIVFWFFTDTIVRYVLQDRSLKRFNKMRAGRLASISVRFSK